MNIILSLSVAAFCAIQIIICDDTLVQVQQGWLQGKKQDAVIGDHQYYSFENIPYAEPPIGSLRFKAPKEPKPWEGTRDATALGPMCPHNNPLSKILTTGSEDCLTCNIYTPDMKGKLPVLVFISGFAHFFDGDVNGLYEADFLVDKFVVVIFNYRLDVFGFLYAGTKDANVGLKDQALLLNWVKNNIEVFGGDPGRVTLAGISSGSASIYHHMMSPMSTGLFHRAIMISGVPSCDAIYPHEVLKQSFELGKRFGLETNDGDELIAFLQEIPYEQLINSSYAMAMEDKRNQLFKKMSTFVPVVEEDFGQDRFIEENPMTSIDEAPLNPVKLMIGFCNKEALIVVQQSIDYLIKLYREDPDLMVPNKILYNATANEIEIISNAIKNHYFGNKEVSVENIEEFVEMNSFEGMIYDTNRFARKISQFIDTYLFEFKSFSSRNIYGLEGREHGIEGASHGDPLGYMFPLTPLNMTVDVDSREYALIKQFVGRITDFVTQGDPSYNADISWHKFTTESMDYLEFSDQMTVKQNPYGEHFRFWDNIYDGHQF